MEIKILHVVSGDLWAGAEVQIYNTLKGLKQRKGLNVSCVLFNQGMLFEKVRDLGVKVILLDESKLSTLSIMWKLVSIAKTGGYDIIHVHKVKEHFLALLARTIASRKAQLLRTVHGRSAVARGLSRYKRLRSSVVVWLDEVLQLSCSDGLIAVSKDLRRYLMNRGVSGRLYQIYNAVDRVPVSGDRIPRFDLRIRYGAVGLFWIGTATRLVETKNLPLLIQAVSLLKLRRVPFRVSIFGDGPLRDSVERLIVRYDLSSSVLLHGFEPEAATIMEGLDAFVLCSKHEGLPMSLLEAMSVGTPAVCTSVGGMKEVITDGQNGLLVPPDDPESLAAALALLYRNADFARRIGSCGQATVQKEFTIARGTDQLTTVYSEMLAS